MKKTVLYIAFASSLLFYMPQSSGQSLQEYVDSATSRYPGVLKAEMEYRAETEREDQMGGFPDPTLEGGVLLRPMHFGRGQQVGRLRISQPVPWFGTLSARRKWAERMSAAKEEGVEQVKNLVAFRVRELYYELYTLRKSLHFRREKLEFLNQIDGIALAQLESGRGSMTDLIRLQMEKDAEAIEIKSLEREIQKAEREFNFYLDRDSSTAIEIPDSLAPSHIAVEFETFDPGNNPVVRRSRELQKAMGERERAEKKKGYPQFGVGLDYMIMQPLPGSTEGGHNIFTPMLSMSIPIFRNKYRAAIREAEELRSAYEQEEMEVKREIEVSYENTRTDLRQALDDYELYRKQAERSASIYRILLEQYSSAGNEFEEVLRILRQKEDYHIKTEEALSKAAQKAAKLLWLNGKY